MNLCFSEVQRPGEQQVVGVVLEDPIGSETNEEFLAWFTYFLLHGTRLESAGVPQITDCSKSISRAVTRIFEDTIRNIASDDLWGSGGGRELFEQQAHWFVAHNVQIEFCLPAFPCKSSNPRKVAGLRPDKGEEMALWRLNNFVKEIEQVYKPGAKVLIVSDGHVFSDCSK